MLPDRLRAFVAENTSELPGIGEEVERHLANVLAMREEQLRFSRRPKLVTPKEEPFWHEAKAELERIESVVDADIDTFGECSWLGQIRYPLFTMLADIKAMRAAQREYRQLRTSDNGRTAGRLERAVDEYLRSDLVDEAQGLLFE